MARDRGGPVVFTMLCHGQGWYTCMYVGGGPIACFGRVIEANSDLERPW